MSKIMIDNNLIINMDNIDEVYMSNCTIQFLYKNGKRHGYTFDSHKETRYVFGKIANMMEIPEEHKIEVFA